MELCGEIGKTGNKCVLEQGHKSKHKEGVARLDSHLCHWLSCDKPVDPKFWGCRTHWYKLPQDLRNKIWATYKPGQEITKTPSKAYMLAAQRVQVWIRSQV